MSYYRQSHLHTQFKDIVMSIYKIYGYNEFTFSDARKRIDGYDISVHKRFLQVCLLSKIKVPYRAHRVKLNINVERIYK